MPLTDEQVREVDRVAGRLGLDRREHARLRHMLEWRFRTVAQAADRDFRSALHQSWGRLGIEFGSAVLRESVARPSSRE
jgi:hypothetical protein